MKKTIIIGLLVVAAATSSYAQCDKRSMLTSSTTEYLNSSGEVRKTVDETTTAEFDSKTITISPGDHVMEGTVDSVITCNWKTAYKEGKSIMKATMSFPDGRSMKVTITIEGKDGKLVLLFEESADMRIRVTLDKFEEKK